METPMTANTPRDVWEVEISNECSCGMYECMDCGAVTSEENSCDSCGLELEMGDGCFEYYEGYCSGKCFEFPEEDLQALWNEFKNQVPAETGFYVIEGSNLGWRRLSGYRIIESSIENLWEQVSVRSEWRQEWRFDQNEKTLTGIQTHHDAPIGESYVVRPATIAEAKAHEENAI